MHALILLIICRALFVMTLENVDNSLEPVPKPACEMLCDDGTCIPSSSWCNGKEDCADGTDEADEYCSRLLCKEGDHNCYGRCASENEICINQIACPYNKFHCGYGGCIDLGKKCDGNFDCPDQTDEYPPLCQ